MLSHVLSSCDATLRKSPIAFEIAKGWMASKDSVRRSCGYGLVYALAKDRKDKRLTDEFFLGCVEKIGNTIAKEENGVRVGIGGALMSIGKRNEKLIDAATTCVTSSVYDTVGQRSQSRQIDPSGLTNSFSS